MLEYVYYLIGFLILYYIVLFIYEGTKKKLPENILGHWDTYFPNLQFSTQEFYTSVETILAQRKIPDLLMLRVEFPQRASFFGREQIYLRVRNASYTFDVCAAPYGTGFFVSGGSARNSVACTGCSFSFLSTGLISEEKCFSKRIMYWTANPCFSRLPIFPYCRPLI